jgi:hypothetical protein
LTAALFVRFFILLTTPSRKYRKRVARLRAEEHHNMDKLKLSLDWWAVIIAVAIVAGVCAYSRIHPHFTFPW